MIQSVTSIFQLLVASLIFIYEDRASPSANLIDTELKYKSCFCFSDKDNKYIITYCKTNTKKGISQVLDRKIKIVLTIPRYLTETYFNTNRV